MSSDLLFAYAFFTHLLKGIARGIFKALLVAVAIKTAAKIWQQDWNVYQQWELLSR